MPKGASNNDKKNAFDFMIGFWLNDDWQKYTNKSVSPRQPCSLTIINCLRTGCSAHRLLAFSVARRCPCDAPPPPFQKDCCIKNTKWFGNMKRIT
jgi:hypothetical protein